MDRPELLRWLRETDELRLAELWRAADEARRAAVGDEVHLRGLLEVSNHCRRSCTYCGIRGPNRAVERYRMTVAEVADAAALTERLGYGSIVVQAGEDPALTVEWVEEVVTQIRARTALAVTLSLGERPFDELARFRRAGADRYLLRFETSNQRVFERIHPPLPGGGPSRLEQLAELRRLGFEVGSGVMIGIPGTTYDDLASDLLAFRQLDLDMIGVGPFIPHPATPMGAAAAAERADDAAGARPPSHLPVLAVGPRVGAEETPALSDDGVPATELMTYKVVALARLLCPRANIPATTALATINLKDGRELGLRRGANVLMPNVTPRELRALYEIYPGKACIADTPEHCSECIRGRIRRIGRRVGQGPGESPNRTARRDAEREPLRAPQGAAPC